MMMKKGGKAKKKSKFPDHSGDGKITKKDILMAKGIIPKKKKMKTKKRERVRVKAKQKKNKAKKNQKKVSLKRKAKIQKSIN